MVDIIADINGRLVMLGKAFFLKLGLNVRKKYKKHIFTGAKDVFGKKFKPYTKAYGERKRAGKLFKQAGDSRGSRAPYVVGDLKNDLMFHNPTDKSVKVGWTKEGAKIGYLSDMGRKVTTPKQPLPKGIIRFIMKEASSEIKRIIKKDFPDGKVIRLPIGKK